MDVQDSLHRLQVQVLTTQRRLRYADYMGVDAGMARSREIMAEAEEAWRLDQLRRWHLRGHGLNGVRHG